MTSIIAAQLWSTILFLSTAENATGDPSTGRGVAPYRWSETSAYVRVPKTFVSEISIPAVTVTNFDNLTFVLTREFTETFLLTASEVERVTGAIVEALREFRT